jgi:hypothetical protein
MNISPIISLRKAIRATLLADGALIAALGGPDVFDEAPRGVAAPYVTFGDAQVRDGSSGSAKAMEQACIIDVWSQQRGIAEALLIATRIADLLDDSNLVLDGWSLANLRLLGTETRREGNGRFARASLRFRAFMELN